MSPRLEERAEIYLLFASLFREAPRSDLLRGMGQGDWAAHADEIAVEFAGLFLVPGEQAVRPYESAWCDTLTIDSSTACSSYFADEAPVGELRGFIGGPSCAAVREAYGQAGFELNPAFHDLPDHLSAELEFLGRLREADRPAQAGQFFTEHLGRWAFRFLKRLQEQPASPFYRTAARALEQFLHEEFLNNDVDHSRV